MTKREFRHDVERGLGSCVLALRDNEAARERFRPLVLWACGRDTAYDAQCEDSRGRYLYHLICFYPDETPFLDVIETRLFATMCRRGWEFTQDCDLLACFTFDGDRRAWEMLTRCYGELYAILQKTRRRDNDSFRHKRHNFEALCVTLVSLCFEDPARERMIYRRIVRDLGALLRENPLFSFEDFDWIQTVSEKELGKGAVQKILCGLRSTDADIDAYAHAMEQSRSEAAQERAVRERTARIELQTTEEIIRTLRGGTPPLSAYWAKRLWRQGKPEEVAKLADAYHAETDSRMRCALLRMLQYEEFAALLQLDALFADSRSGDEKLAYYAFNALEHQTCTRVRAYAYALLQGDAHTAQAVKLLAANYTDADRAALIEAVRRVPIRYGDHGWHSAFHNVMELFHTHKAHGLNELLPYFYHNTLCSFCRGFVVKEMGRRHMLTPELLAEMQYDCCDEIRAYAAKRLRAAEQKTKRGNAPDERNPDESKPYEREPDRRKPHG